MSGNENPELYESETQRLVRELSGIDDIDEDNLPEGMTIEQFREIQAAHSPEFKIVCHMLRKFSMVKFFFGLFDKNRPHPVCRPSIDGISTKNKILNYAEIIHILISRF